jgi:hypothetical protein
LTSPSVSPSDPLSTCYEVPVRFVPSHGIARPGFQSNRKGLFWHGCAELEATPFEMTDADVLGTPLHRLSITYRGGDTYLLSLEFVAACSVQEAEDFIQRFVDAFTVSMAGNQRDPWYGNLLLEAIWTGLRNSTPKPPGTFCAEISTALTSEEMIPVSGEVLQALNWSPLTRIFAEGMRAAQPKSKFLFWFVILEELESRDEFKKLFNPLFSEEEKKQLLQATLSAGSKQRLEGLLNNPSVTQQGRPEKLLAILQQIALGEVKSLGKTITIDLAICRSLIKQRNNIAHKGAMIDLDELYMVLFPLANGALVYLTPPDHSP